MRVILATNNENKANEIRTLVKDLGIEILSLKDLNDTDKVLETGKTFSENAYLKAKHYFDKYKCPVLADDSGLVVASLNNAPGVYSARYAGDNANDNLNNSKLLKDLEGIKNREAYFNCTICYIDKDIYYFEGQVHGTIAYDLKGEHGFGYDPLFVLDNGIRLAEMPIDQKNKISHRAKALEKWLQFMRERD